MSLSDLASLGSFVSGLAILVSLILLYFQLRQVNQQVRQAEKNQQASIRQGRAARSSATSMGVAENPALADAILKALTGAPDITTTQLYQFNRYCFAVFSGHEDSFYQNQDGLLTDSAFTSVVNSMGRGFSQAAVRLQWKRVRASYGAEFVKFVDGLIARAPIGPTSLDPAEWLSDLAGETSGP